MTKRTKGEPKVEEEPLTLLADTAITDPSHDRLDRAPFARSLARSLLSLDGDDSFVFGLCGPWGSGKTSVLNLLLKELAESAEEQRPLVVKFNPWWFSGRHQLLEAFLGQLAPVLSIPQKGTKAKKVSKLLGLLSAGLRPVSLLPFVGEIAKAGKDVADAVAGAAESYANAAKKNVVEIRKEIDAILTEFPKRIVVVMDDIDRLSAGEIADLFLILKAVADFPKTVYVLAFDHRVVRRAIRQKLGVNGKVYLEKIVQLQIDLPTIGNVAVQSLFLEQLSALVGETTITENAKVDFGNVFHDGLKHFLTTPRAAKKLLNMLRFTYPSLKGEVYLPDLVAIDCLATFVPQAIHAISNNREHFVGSTGDRDDRKELEAFHKGWLSQVSNRDRAAVEGIVRRLFPRAGWVLGDPMHGSDWERGWRNTLRVCSDAHFEKYLLLSLPAGAIGEAEWQQIVALLADGTAFDARVRSLAEEQGRKARSSRAVEFLDRALDYAHTKPPAEKARTLFMSLLRVGDTLCVLHDEDLLAGVFPLNNSLRLTWVLLALLESVPSGEGREVLLADGVKQTSTLLTAAELVRSLGLDHGMYGSKREANDRPPVVSQQCAEAMRDVIVKRIAEASLDEGPTGLVAHPAFMEVVNLWRILGGEEPPRKWIQDISEDDKRLVGIVKQVASKSRSHGSSDRVARESIVVNTEYLGCYFDLKTLKAESQRIIDEAPEWLSPEEKLVMGIVVQCITDDGQPIDQRELWRRRMMSGEDG